MQNDHFHIVPRSGASEDSSGYFNMSDFLTMPFHQLWEGSRVRSASFDLLSGRDYSSVSTEESTFVERPHVNFDAIHALQGSSGPAGYGYGTFDLLPNDPSRVKRGVSKRAFRRLEKVSVTGRDMGDCHICMETFKSGAQCTKLPCEHLFCTACIKEWLKNNNTCPVCRYKFPDSQTQLTSM